MSTIHQSWKDATTINGGEALIAAASGPSTLMTGLTIVKWIRCHTTKSRIATRPTASTARTPPS